MDIKQLEAFVAVAKNQSFSKAAKELFFDSANNKLPYTKPRKWNADVSIQ